MAVRKTLVWMVAVPAVLVVLAVGGTWVYLNMLRADAAAPLTIDAGAGTTSPSTGTGTWTVASGSQAGYRVKEILFGQSATAVGRTTKVTGSFTVAGTTVTKGGFSVDMVSVASDESRRDQQFAGRIMAVATHPTATFELTSPIELGATTPTETKAAGKLTLRGTTKAVTIDLTVKVGAGGATAEIAGTFPVVFAEWGIPNPTNGPAQTEDNGVMEFLLVANRA
jgi:polyisoprenoid-binding protein YceI